MIFDDAQIEMLLEKSLAEGLTPEEVCVDEPQLLHVLRQRWEECRAVSFALDGLFPSSAVRTAATDSGDGPLPEIPGYELYEVLGRGGMGIVFRGRHLKLNRQIALKMMLPGSYAGPAELKRFEREAQIVASLCHPHIVQVFDVGDAAGRPYYTMELISGGSLAEMLTRSSRSIRESAALVIQLATALDLVHRSGVIHRDLKPGNILLTEEGIPKIGDFGLAYQPAGRTDVTLNSTWLGTPSYMAPEQALGKTSSVGPAADIYSLGAILYELLTGWPPFRAESAMELQRLSVNEDPLPPGRLNQAVPRDLEAICLKCLEKDPRQRYRTAGELQEDLTRFLNHIPVLARRVTNTDRVQRWIQRNPAISVALAGIAVLTFMLLVGSIWSAAHFRELAQTNGRLAWDKSLLARQFESERDKALSAEHRESGLRSKADALSATYLKNLYIAEMTLATQASAIPGGIARVHDLLSNWTQTATDLRDWEWYYLNGLCHQDQGTFQAHLRGALDVAWSPDGTQLATAGVDKTICLLDRSGKRPPRRLTGHEREVLSVMWNSDGTRLASASWDGRVKVWDALSSQLLFDCAGVYGELFCVDWSPDDQSLVAGCKDGVIRVWNANTGELRRELTGHIDAVAGVAWSPDGTLIASAGHDHTVRIWSASTMAQERVLRGHTNWVNDVEWSPDGSRCASAGNDQTARIWNPLTGTEELSITGHRQSVISLSWKQDGQELATASDDMTARVWSTLDGTQKRQASGHLAELTGVAWAPDGSEFASCGYDGNVKLWSESSPHRALPLTRHGDLQVVAWNPTDSEQLAAAWGEGFVQVWDTQEQAVIGELRAEGTYLRSAQWHPNGKTIATGSEDGLIRLWNLDSPGTPATILDQGRPVLQMCWDPQGKWLAATGLGPVTIWDVVERKRLREFSGNGKPFATMCPDPKGELLAIGAEDGTINLWNMSNGEEVLTYQQHRSRIVSMAWSPDGKLLASTSLSPLIHLWDPRTGELLRTLNGHTATSSQLAWSRDGCRLATVAHDGRLKIWDAECGREVLNVENTYAWLNSVSWSRDSRSIAMCDQHQSVWIADAAAGYIAAKSSQLLPDLDAKILRQPTPADLLLRAQVYQGMRDWKRAGADLDEQLRMVSSPWIVMEAFISRPYHAGSSDAPGGRFVSGAEQAEVLAAAVAPLNGDLWQPLEGSQQGVIDFTRYTEGRNETSVFLLFPVFSAVDQPVSIRIGSDDDCRVTVNQQTVFEYSGPRAPLPDQDTIPTNLIAGWNWVLVEVVNRTGDHGLYFRLSDPDSTEPVAALP
ncbi:WD40 repeat domain-containing serine/threonine protein kinase [Planctomicrobium piriforme]|uniref:WD40 repeat domain-containing serine/threonine protein kinase n=1 Tax=Planctomicrobium piriforme TaxID=1576369 RepID=UPI00158710F8|nr:serine/threonine-protein kinase [Planctomicrobium piriforme]